MDFAEDGKPVALRDPWGSEIDATTVAAGGQ
jgi:para-nitrobenzyl esterase